MALTIGSICHVVSGWKHQLNTAKIACKCVCLVITDSSVQSVVSFDQGGEWVPLRKPANSKCDATAKDPDKVREETGVSGGNTKIDFQVLLIKSVYI